MTHTISITSPNEQLARQVNLEARQNSNSPYAGKFVGIGKGQVIVVAESWRMVADHLLSVEPDHSKCFCLEASADYDRVQDIWRVA